LLHVRSVEARHPDDDGVGGDVAQALRVAVEQAGEPAHHVERGQEINGPQKVPHDHLAGLQPHALEIDHAQAQESLAHGLAAPEPLQQDAVGKGYHEHQDDADRLREIRADETNQCRNQADHVTENQDAEQVHAPRQKTGGRPGEPGGKDHSLRRANGEGLGAGVHGGVTAECAGSGPPGTSHKRGAAM
jgi:hypothetical protein